MLTDVNFKIGKSTGNLVEQLKASLKKFKRRAVVRNEKDGQLPAKTKDTFVTKEVEAVLVEKGWKKPKKRRRSGSAPGSEGGGGYQGRKNNLGSNGLSLKCFKCKCDHESNCNCPCDYHSAKAKQVKSNSGATTSDARDELGLIMTTEFTRDVTETLLCLDEDLCLLTASMEACLDY